MIASTLVPLFADAIAFAEGFYVTGSRPARNHNPGNLTVDTTGTGIGMDGPFIRYATDADGWAALYRQIERMISGSSAYYSPSMSIQQIANTWTATQPIEWARNVASRLGVSVNTTINEMLATGAGIGLGAVALLVLVLYLLKKKG